MALLSQPALRGDPVLNHNFVVSLIDTSSTLALLGSIAMSAIFDVALGGFTECSGLEMSLQTEEYKEGGNNGAYAQVPDARHLVEHHAQERRRHGHRAVGLALRLREGKGKRRDGVIVLLNDRHVPNNIWYFRRGLPVKYTGPSLNATQNNVAIESIEIAHEGISRCRSSGPAPPRWARSRAWLLGILGGIWHGGSNPRGCRARCRRLMATCLLSPQTMDKIVRAVLEAVNDRETHAARVRAERRITSGVSHELEERE